MAISYCLPVIKKHKQEVLDEIAHLQTEYAYFEVWLDYVEGADEAFVTSLCERYPGKLLFLFRRQELEPIRMSLDMRFKLLQVLNQSLTLVDLDMSQHKELDYLQENGLVLQLIASYHNYHETPSDDKLRQITSELLSRQPAIVKVAAYCHTEEDALRLLGLQLWLKRQGCRHIVLGMGMSGVVTRVFGALWGSELVFAPQTDNGISASGQLTRTQLENVFYSLGA